MSEPATDGGAVEVYCIFFSFAELSQSLFCGRDDILGEIPPALRTVALSCKYGLCVIVTVCVRKPAVLMAGLWFVQFTCCLLPTCVMHLSDLGLLFHNYSV